MRFSDELTKLLLPFSGQMVVEMQDQREALVAALLKTAVTPNIPYETQNRMTTSAAVTIYELDEFISSLRPKQPQPHETTGATDDVI